MINEDNSPRRPNPFATPEIANGGICVRKFIIPDGLTPEKIEAAVEVIYDWIEADGGAGALVIALYPILTK